MVVERVDIWRRGGKVRAFTMKESETLVMLREVYNRDEVLELPSLKAQDGRRIE